MLQKNNEMQNNSGVNMNPVENSQTIIASENGREMCNTPGRTTTFYLTDSLTGILQNNSNLDAERKKALDSKYDLSSDNGTSFV